MEIRKELKYTPDHEWVRVEGQEAYIGITDFAQKELGDIVYVDVDSVGETLEKGAAFGTIEAVKTVSDVFMPFTGEVLEFNENVESQPELLNKSPYDDGWIVKVSIADLAELDTLIDADSYSALVNG